MVRYFFTGLIVFVGMGLAVGKDDESEPLPLHPAALPSPALKYRLLPSLASQTPGDAVPLYNEAVAAFLPLQREIYQLRPDNPFPKWADTPLKELPRDEVRKALEPFKEFFEILDKAARCERCIGDSAKLPESYYLQEFSTFLAVRARVQMADGDLTAALHTLQTGLSFAKQTGELPRLGYPLTSAAIAETMFTQLETFVQQPKAPNLYWALTDLPQPLIDPRKGVDGERRSLYRLFPGIAEARADLNAGPLTEAQVQDCVTVLLRYYREPTVFREIESRTNLTKRLTANYEEYKKALLDEGRPKEKVEAMPHVQVALLAAFQEYDQSIDEQMKWYNEPYASVSDRLNQLNNKVETRPREKRFYPVVAFGATQLQRDRARLERRINMLRCQEALRAYAAGHDGKLPASLSDVKDVPIPVDLVTGKAFEYKVTGDKATLETPECNREDRRYFADVVLEFTIKRS